jgi:hypothetical protein
MDNKIDKIIKYSINECIKRSLMETHNSDFEEWFSNNGLTDENGKPLLVYHGSGNDFKSFNIDLSYDGKLCFSPDKKDALIYTQWNNGDDNWRTVNNAYEFLDNKGYRLNDKLDYPERLNLLNMIDIRTGEPIDKQYAYNIIYKFYKKQYGNPTLYYCFIRNAEKSEDYNWEYNIYDDEDVWVLKKEHVNYKPIPVSMEENDSLNTYIE